MVVFGVLSGCGRDAGPASPPLGSDPIGGIVGRVTDLASGVPIAGASLEVTPSSAIVPRDVRSDGRGEYRIEGVPPGSYAVSASKEGFGSAVKMVVVRAGAAVPADLVLAPLAAGQPQATGSVTGLVLRSTGEPVAEGIPVEILRDGATCGGGGVGGGPVVGPGDGPPGGAAGGPVVALTDAGGRFLALGLPEGVYLACVRAAIGGRELTGVRGFVVTPEQLSRADLTLRSPADPAPAPGATGEAIVSLGEPVAYRFTIVGAGEGISREVVITDTLPLRDDPAGPPGPGDRDGDQAFRYVTDRPTFDPDAIRYYIDRGDDAGGTETDVCFQAPATGFPDAFATPEAGALCGGSFLDFPTIDEARAAAENASAAGDQVVAVEYFDADILLRTPPGGELEAEDSFEITVEAIHSVNELRLDDGSIPEPGEENGQWCNIVTATSAENDFVVKTACTRVVEALLQVRKTAADALVPAGGQTAFLIEIGNEGSEELSAVTVSDTLDDGFLDPATGDPGVVRVEGLCAGCAVAFNADSTIVTVAVPVVPATDADRDGIFDDDEGLAVATVVVRAPLRRAQLCNRVTAVDGAGRRDSDLACVLTELSIELDIVNRDGLIVNGAFTDVETFETGDTVAYRTRITNRSAVAATDVRVRWEIAPEFGILALLPGSLAPADPPSITCDAVSGACSVTLASFAPGASIELGYSTLARLSGEDVNRITLQAAELSRPVVNEEPTTVNP